MHKHTFPEISMEMLQMKVAELPEGRVNVAGKRVTVWDRRHKEMAQLQHAPGQPRALGIAMPLCPLQFCLLCQQLHTVSLQCSASQTYSSEAAFIIPDKASLCCCDDKHREGRQARLSRASSRSQHPAHHCGSDPAQLSAQPRC